MACTISIEEKPVLNDPILIEGLPGIGFVANIVALHMIKELKAQRFARIFSASFQDLAIATETGEPRTPINELYYYKNSSGRDLIIWYGNTQALTTFGQYELCGKVLNLIEELGCKFIITIGGYRQEEPKEVREVYCAASDPETLNMALGLGTKVMVGNIFGIAGILIALGALKGFKGFSILVETPGLNPDAKAASYALNILNKFLGLNVSSSGLDLTAEEISKILESFGWVKVKEKQKKWEEFKWFV